MAEELRDRPNYYMDEGGDGHGMGRPGGGKTFYFGRLPLRTTARLKHIMVRPEGCPLHPQNPYQDV